MQKKCNKNLLSLILSTMLIVAMAFSMTACGGNTENQNTEMQMDAGAVDNVQNNANAQDDSVAQTDVTVVGEGATVFTFVVVDKDGNETRFEVHTDKTVVGDALLELGLIAGDAAEYGLYVKTVNEITADYDVDGTYWAFYIDGEYGMTGVDTTPIEEGATYSFKVE